MDSIKLEKQENGKYTMKIKAGKAQTVRKDMTIQEVVYELEMRTYTEDCGRTE